MPQKGNKQTLLISNGGGSANDKGYFADLTALQTAHPTGSNGWFAITGTPDAIWIWDSGTSAWVNTGTTGSVSSVFTRTGAVTAQAGDYNASQITNTPAGNIGSVTVQTALNELDSEKQPLDSDLTAIAGLTPSNDDIIQRKAGAWTNRTPAQVKTDLSLTKSDVGLSNVDNTSDVNKPISTATQTALDGKVDENVAITGATKTKITYDAKGLVTAGTDATTADIADSTNKRYVTDAQLTVIGNTSGTNTGDNAVNTLYSGLVSNATHTGDVTGATALTIDKTAITGKTAVTAVGTDYVLISDTSDSGNLKKALVSDFGGGGSGTPGGADTQVQFNDGGAFGGDARFYFDKSTGGATGGDFGAAAGASTDGAGGEIYVEGGRAGRGGGVQAFAGNAIGVDCDGGDLYFASGSANGTGVGGRVYFQAGGTGVGGIAGDVEFQIGDGDTKGKYLFRKADTNYAGELDFESLTADRKITFQDASGTLAYLSDIPAGVLKLPTYTVGAATADYPGFTDTAIQAALNAGNGRIFLTDGTYVLSTGLKFKSNYQYIEGNGEKCIIQFNGATVATAISPNATNLKQGGIKGVSIQQTNATVQGTALDLSDMAIMDIDVEIKDAGVAVKMNDANNNTFYNRVYIKAFGCARGIEMNGTNPSNHNYFSGRIANKSGGDYGIYIVKGQGNHFEDMSLEPVATTGNTGIYLTSASTYANTFENMWIEGNNVGVTVDSSVTYNTFTSGTITANTTNLTDNGKQTAFYNTQVGAVQKTNINPGTVIDNGNASDIAWNIKNNTSFAHVGGALVETELRNASDTSILNRWKHAGTGKFVSALNGATELFSVDSSGSSSTMLSQVQNIITKDTTINAGFSTYIPSYMEVGSGFTLTISDTAHLQVG